MAIALDTLGKINIRQLSRGFCQASVLEAEHAVKKDDAAALSIGTEVTYTDDDLGFVFRGRIVDIREQWNDGEGIIYSCADAYRRLVKTPAMVGGSTVIKFSENRTTHDVLDTILAEMPSSIFPAGYNLGTLPDFVIPKTDKAGQSYDNWINEVLRHTDDGVCWVEYVDMGGGNFQPRLQFGSMSAVGTLDLEEGDYTQIDPATNASPLIVEGALGETLDDKYEVVRLEGCGNFVRVNEQFLPITSVIRDPIMQSFFTFRWNIPYNYAMSRYLDEAGHCREGTLAEMQFGNDIVGQPAYRFDIRNPPLKYDETTGEYYFEIPVRVFGVFSVDPPPVPVVYAWFTYTALDSPFIGERSAIDPRLSNEGIYVEQHPELFTYVDSTLGQSVDNSGMMDEMLSALYERYCVAPDSKGSLTAHIKGLDPDVKLGATIIDPTDLDGTTVRGITYDFIMRNMVLDCSNVPLRSEVFNAQRRQEQRSELGGNWYLPKDKGDPDEESCFCGGPLFKDHNGYRPPSNNDPEHRGPTWDCIQGNCEQRADDMGQYNTLADCERDCAARGWDFVPCVGCVPSDQQGFGQYDTQVACENDNPDPFDPAFNCDQGSSDPASGSGPGSPTSGEAEGRTYECDGCGVDMVGFIKSIVVDKGGHIVTATCENCPVSSSTEGYTGSFTVLGNYELIAEYLVGSLVFFSVGKVEHNLYFSDGLLKDVYSSSWTEVQP